jgi:hypothetical protein
MYHFKDTNINKIVKIYNPQKRGMNNIKKRESFIYNYLITLSIKLFKSLRGETIKYVYQRSMLKKIYDWVKNNLI